MRVLRTVAEARAFTRSERRRGRSLALVPTMGAWHEGHLSLLRAARRSSACVVGSIFVNPLQFGPREDYDAYPRDEARDLVLARDEDVDAVFIPTVDEMYREGDSTRISVGALGAVLEGAHRPGHFEGVCTVVAKLFNVVHPDRAFFGQKDAQQVAVVRRMVADLAFPIEIVVGETVRERDGVALSSRNAYLSADERKRATALIHALEAGRDVLAATGSAARAEARMAEVLAHGDGIEVHYARAVDPETFQAPASDAVLLVVAARVGKTRLIDNLIIRRSAQCTFP